MPRRQRAKTSIFLNVAAWALLALMLLAGAVALFSTAGLTSQEFKLGKLAVRTTSTAIIVMVISSVPLWAILHFALTGKIRLFETDDTTWIERNARLFEATALILGLVGIAVMIWS